MSSRFQTSGFRNFVLLRSIEVADRKGITKVLTMKRNRKYQGFYYNVDSREKPLILDNMLLVLSITESDIPYLKIRNIRYTSEPII
jgi:hypothetical protein